jgi:hypothetical protein
MPPMPRVASLVDRELETVAHHVCHYGGTPPCEAPCRRLQQGRLQAPDRPQSPQQCTRASWVALCAVCILSDTGVKCADSPSQYATEVAVAWGGRLGRWCRSVARGALDSFDAGAPTQYPGVARLGTGLKPVACGSKPLRTLSIRTRDAKVQRTGRGLPFRRGSQPLDVGL